MRKMPLNEKKIRNAMLQKLKNKESKTEKSRMPCSPSQNRSDVTNHISYTGNLKIKEGVAMNQGI